MAKDERIGTDTLQLDEPFTDDFVPISDNEPEEFIPTEETGGNEQRYEKAEKTLNIVTGVLSVLLILGSLVFWWYFAGRISVCAMVINNYKLYGAMLISCAAVTFAATVIQAVRRTRICPENWLVNMCVSGLITAVAMVIYNVTALGHSAAMNDVLTILCFSISGCALPAAIYTLIRLAAERLIGWTGNNAAKDRAVLYADVQAQCESRF